MAALTGCWSRRLSSWSTTSISAPDHRIKLLVVGVLEELARIDALLRKIEDPDKLLDLADGIRDIESEAFQLQLLARSEAVVS